MNHDRARAAVLNAAEPSLDGIWQAFGPSQMLFGVGSATDIPRQARRLGARRVLVLTSLGVAERPAHAQVIDDLRASDMTLATFGVPPDPDPIVIERIHRDHATGQWDLVVGLGGGSVLDAAKLVALLLTHRPGEVALDHLRWIQRGGVPTILVPTTAGSGSEATHEAVLVDPRSRTKFALKDSRLTASVAVVDPRLTVSCGPRLTAGCGADALVHALEAVTGRRSTPMAELIGSRAFTLIFGALPRSIAAPDSIEARHDLMLGSHLAGLAFAGTGTAAIHACGYPLTTYHGIPHGVANGMMAAAVVGYNQDQTRAYGELARAIGVTSLADALRALMAQIGIPNRLRDAGVRRGDLVALARSAATDRRHLDVNPKPLDEAALLRLFERAW